MSQEPKDFKLIMISAMYENGGNTLHRFLDGHPQLYVYPFESQPSTPLVNDYLSSVFPLKYRWPEIYTSGKFEEDYELIIDEELKRHVKTPFASKFKDMDLNFSDKERKEIFLKLVKNKDRSRRTIVEAYLRSTFLAWKSYNKSGKETTYVGYSPIIGVDAEKIFSDFPDSHIIHIVRNPYSAYSDTKKRPVPYGIARYADTWGLVQLFALNYSKIYPKNFHLVKFEDLVASPKIFFAKLVKEIGIKYSATLEYPSWNGQKLDSVVPWGTIRTPTAKSNKTIKEELSKAEYEEVKKRTQIINKLLCYDQL